MLTPETALAYQFIGSLIYGGQKVHQRMKQSVQDTHQRIMQAVQGTHQRMKQSVQTPISG